MTSMYTVARRAISQLDESRARPITKPRMVARTTPMAATSTVLSRPTQKTRALDDSSLYAISVCGMPNPAGWRRNPKPEAMPCLLRLSIVL